MCYMGLRGAECLAAHAGVRLHPEPEHLSGE